MKQFKNILFWIGAALTLLAFFRLFRKPESEFREISVSNDLRWDKARYRSDADSIEAELQGWGGDMDKVLKWLHDYRPSDLRQLYNAFGMRRLAMLHLGWPYTGIAGKDGDLIYWLRQESSDSQWPRVVQKFKGTGLI